MDNLDNILQWIQTNMPDLYPNDGRIEGWRTEVEGGDRRNADDIRDDIVKYIIGPELVRLGYSQDVVDQLTLGADEGGMNLSDIDIEAGPDASQMGDDAIEPEGEGDVDGVLAGGATYKITRVGQEDYYVQMYEYPPNSGKFVAFQYDDEDAMRAAVGDVEVQGMPETTFASVANIAGNAAELLGDTGSFNLLMEDIMRDTAADAGITDPTLLGQYLANPDVQHAMAMQAVGAWSEEQAIAHIRASDYYQNTLYPGIANFYDRTDNPEAAYAQYRANVASNLEALGVQRDADGTYKSTIGALLNGGVTDTELAEFTPTFVKAAGNDVYRQNLNQWVTSAGLDPISDFNTFFDVMSGTSTPELNEIVELAGLSFAAQNAGSDISTDLFKELASSTDISDEGAAALFTDLERSLIAMGDAGLANYGISVRDVLLNKAGVTSGGRTTADMQNLFAKIAQERGTADNPRASYYTEYNRDGSPYKAGLRSSVAEGA